MTDLDRWAARLDRVAQDGPGEALRASEGDALHHARRLATARLRSATGYVRALRAHAGSHDDLELASDHPGAALLEWGGVVRRRTVPLRPEAIGREPRSIPGIFAVRSRAGRLLLARRDGAGGLVPLYWVAPSLRYDGRHIMTDALRRTTRDVEAHLADQLRGDA